MTRGILAFAVILAGCATAGPTQQERREAYYSNLRGQCSTLGFQSGTEAHTNCMFQLHQQNQANSGAAAAAILGRPQPQPYQHQPYYIPITPQTTTNCQFIGNQMYCSSR